jgi:predicted adenine nucleotide alpha hydrolase (AANH) superfamily ATPase
MSILLHVCCAPCLLYPARILANEGVDFTCYFYNPNIHPFREFRQRLETLKQLIDQRRYPCIIEPDYGLRDFLRAVVFGEGHRCSFCYSSRLTKTAQRAVEEGFNGFSTTLLYSRFQNHTAITNIGHHCSDEHAVPFIYHDFRVGWEEGIRESRELALYRQGYCGCIFSEEERYNKQSQNTSTDHHV